MKASKMASIWNSGFDPLSESRQGMDWLLDDFWGPMNLAKTWRDSEADWSPACDVHEEEDRYCIAMDLPGVQKEQIRLDVAANQLTVSGERRQDLKKEGEGAWYSERRHGRFSRSFRLPGSVDSDRIEANYHEGTLKIEMPKSESGRPRQIKIISGSGPGLSGKLIGESLANDQTECQSTSRFEREKVAS